MLPEMFTPAQMDARMDAGVTTFARDIPPNFQRDMLAGRKPAIQLNVDATRIGQALTATHMCRQVTSEVKAFAERYRGARRP